MRIGVISDTHGNKASIERAVTVAGPVEMWLHAGDYSQDAHYLKNYTGLPVTMTAGNCDANPSAKIDEFIEAGGKKIWLTHGHRYQDRSRSDELVWWARHYGVDVVIYGHSHIPDITWVDSLLVFNPGSAAQPRSAEGRSCGLLVIENGVVGASVYSV